MQSFITCISLFLAHDDEISDFFVESNFIQISRNLLQHEELVPPILVSLSNIASVSPDYRHFILENVSIEFLVNLSKSSLPLLAQLSKNANEIQRPYLLLNYFISFYNTPESINALWGTHYLLTNLKIDLTLFQIQFIPMFLPLLSDPTNIQMNSIGCILLTDLAQHNFPGFSEFDISILIPFLNSENTALVKTASTCLKEIIKKQSEEKTFKFLLDIIEASTFIVKKEIIEIIYSLIIHSTSDQCVMFIDNGLFPFISFCLDFDEVILVKNSIEILIKIFSTSEEIGNEKNCIELMESNEIISKIENLDYDEEISFEINLLLSLIEKYKPLFDE